MKKIKEIPMTNKMKFKRVYESIIFLESQIKKYEDETFKDNVFMESCGVSNQFSPGRANYAGLIAQRDLLLRELHKFAE